MIDKTILKQIPQNPGIYTFKDGRGRPIYVGKAKNLRGRLSYYFHEKFLEAKTKMMLNQAAHLSFLLTSSEIDALLLEAKLIRKYKPRFNLTAKENSNSLYVQIGGREKYSEFPRVSLVRPPVVGRSTFGPFPYTTSIRFLIRHLRKVFNFRDCSPTKFERYRRLKRGCLFFDLKLCPAPCALKIERGKYLTNLRALRNILSGRMTAVEKSLKEEMHQAAQKMNFEKAGEIKKKLEALQKIKEIRFSPEAYLENPNLIDDLRRLEQSDLINFYNQASQRNESRHFHFRTNADYTKPHREATAGLEPLTTVERIEAYDVSNLQGQLATASLIVFINGRPEKKEYRRFKIRFSQTKPNDVAMIREVLNRRLKHPEWTKPNLILIDGGLGQLRAAQAAIQENGENLPILALAKRKERVVLFDRYLNLPRNSNVANLLRRIRDESHRFAKVYHQLLRLRILS